MRARSCSWVLVIALGAVLAVGCLLAYRQTVPPERGVSLQQLSCLPAEPPVSRLGCSQ